MLDTATIVAELEAERDRLDSAIAALQGSQGSRIRVATGRADGRGQKAKIHQKIVEDASECVRAEGLSGAAVSAVMRDTGLTHAGFYKHFTSKDDLARGITERGFPLPTLWFGPPNSRPLGKHGKQS